MEKARFLWHCRRGMLELDIILNRFMETGFSQLSHTQYPTFDRLLNCNDPEIYSWLMGSDMPADKELEEIVTFIRNHS